MQIKATRPVQLRLIDPLRVPEPMREDPQTGQWTKDPRREQCPECLEFFTKTTQGHKFCSKKCRNTASRRGVKQRRIESLRAMVQAQEHEIERQAKILEGMKVLLLDLEGAALP